MNKKEIKSISDILENLVLNFVSMIICEARVNYN